MKVKFENCEVDLWKLRKGVVVLCKDGACHINLLGIIWKPEESADVVGINIKYFKDGVIRYQDVDSSKLTWLEPH